MPTGRNNSVTWKLLGFLSDSMVKNQPSMQEPQETLAPSLGQEDPLEEGTATHSSILASGVPCTEESGGYSPQGLKESDTT